MSLLTGVMEMEAIVNYLKEFHAIDDNWRHILLSIQGIALAYIRLREPLVWKNFLKSCYSFQLKC